MKPTKSDIESAFDAAVREDIYCSLGKILSEQDPATRALLEGRINDNVRYSANVVSRVMRGLDFPPVSANTISKHRQGLCRCPRA